LLTIKTNRDNKLNLSCRKYNKLVCCTLSRLGDSNLIYSTLLLTAGSTGQWSPNIGIVMVVANLLAIAIGRFAIQKRGVGPRLPLEVPGLFTGFGWPELLATMSFGHLLGAGAILGLSNAGVL
jgi:photosystem I subunit 10